MLAMLHTAPEFSWSRFTINPSILIGCSLLLTAYFAGVGPLRRKYQWADRVETWQPVCFTAGVLVMFGALNGPLHDLSDYYLLSAHMVQHLLLTLVMAPLLLVGTPDWLLRALIRRTVGFGTARALTGPLLAFGIYNIVLAGWHVPMFYNWALENHNVHIVQHLMFMVAAVIVWWPVVEPLPELSRMITPVRMVFLFALSIPMSLLSALITLSDTVIYPWYDEAPRVFSVNALSDQQLGGLIMWVPGALIFWVAISIIFYRWNKREEKEEWAERALIQQTASS